MGKIISKLVKITFLDIFFLSLLTLVLFLSRIRLQSYINKFNSIMPNLNSLIPGLQNQDLESINKATLIVSKFENLTNLAILEIILIFLLTYVIYCIIYAYKWKIITISNSYKTQIIRISLSSIPIFLFIISLLVLYVFNINLLYALIPIIILLPITLLFYSIPSESKKQLIKIAKISRSKLPAIIAIMLLIIVCLLVLIFLFSLIFVKVYTRIYTGTFSNLFFIVLSLFILNLSKIWLVKTINN